MLVPGAGIAVLAFIRVTGAIAVTGVPSEITAISLRAKPVGWSPRCQITLVTGTALGSVRAFVVANETLGIGRLGSVGVGPPAHTFPAKKQWAAVNTVRGSISVPVQAPPVGRRIAATLGY